MFATILLIGVIGTQDAFAGTSPDLVIPEWSDTSLTLNELAVPNAIVSPQVVPTNVDCNVDSNVVAWDTTSNPLPNIPSVDRWQIIADDIEANLGVTVREVQFTNSVPGCIDTLVLTLCCVGSGPMGAVKEATIIDWVNDGGTVFIQNDFGQFGAGHEAFLSNFGISSAIPGSGNNPSLDFDQNHPIMDGVTGLVFNTYTTYFTDGTLDTVAEDNNFPDPAVMLAGPFGSGCVVITSDHNWSTDTGGITNLDNRLVANNIFAFLFLKDCIEPVGGEFLPIDSTALLLAGLQTSAIWMLPVLAGAVGIGAFYIKTRMNKE